MISEPVTALTDYALAVCAGVWGSRLWAGARRCHVRAMRWWAGSFAAAAVAALAGGTVHGFRAWLGPGGEAVLWKLTLYAVGVYGVCVLAAALWASAAPALRRWALGVVLAAFVAYGTLLLENDDFLYAIVAYIPALLVLLVTQVVAWIRGDAPAAPWLVIGVLVSLAAAAVQRTGIAVHPLLNANDLYHLIQIVGAYLFYRGGLLLADR